MRRFKNVVSNNLGSQNSLTRDSEWSTPTFVIDANLVSICFEFAKILNVNPKELINSFNI